MPSNMKNRLFVNVIELDADGNSIGSHPLVPLRSIRMGFTINNTKIHSVNKPNVGTARGNTNFNWNFIVSTVLDPVAGFNPAEKLAEIALLGLPFNIVVAELKTPASYNRQNFAWESVAMEDCDINSGEPISYTSEAGEPVAAFAGIGSALNLDGKTYDGMTVV